MKRLIFIILLLLLSSNVLAHGGVDDGDEQEAIPVETPRNGFTDVGSFAILMSLPFIITWFVYLHRTRHLKLKIVK